MNCLQLCRSGVFGIGKQCAGFHPEGKSPHLCEEHLRKALLVNMKEMLEVLEGCFIVGHGNNAICFKCYAVWPNHAEDCKLAAVIAKNEPLMELAA